VIYNTFSLILSIFIGFLFAGAFSIAVGSALLLAIYTFSIPIFVLMLLIKQIHSETYRARGALKTYAIFSYMILASSFFVLLFDSLSFDSFIAIIFAPIGIILVMGLFGVLLGLWHYVGAKEKNFNQYPALIALSYPGLYFLWGYALGPTVEPDWIAKFLNEYWFLAMEYIVKPSAIVAAVVFGIIILASMRGSGVASSPGSWRCRRCGTTHSPDTPNCHCGGSKLIHGDTIYPGK